ncbi:MAG: divalent metal cation transporter [Planctomycetes bacterium]|nr:divalent metal cation transporter [Planctomycetota bacterium]
MSAQESRGGRGALVGAAFLMATSAIGPGFLTQTAVFTGELGASFGFAILASIAIDLVAQLAIWRTILAAGRPAQDVANSVVPGLGTLLALLVAFGGLAFNIGNLAGAGLGLEALLGLDPRLGAALSAGFAVSLFLSREAGRAMDRVAQALGVLMLALMAWVAFSSGPPVGEALARSVMPERIDPLAIVTIVGGTVGGYITFAGAHRLQESGARGESGVALATRSALLGIGVASAMRALLFLAALGVVVGGVTIAAAANPAAAVFESAAGASGRRLFGLVMWSAAITSVVGCAYTSVSFVRTLRPSFAGATRPMLLAFVALSAAIFLVVGKPVKVLVLAGALNGLILPLGLAAMLLASRRSALALPRMLEALAWIVTLAMGAMGGVTLFRELPKLVGS